ncbi:hypothetical protein CVT24_005651 [Panaeolus cyanescens]|uniref:Uncharacterized protein n=1 Tax=Panaeolus cyanescens TaxID=181874 RepID=A0A409V9I9_9AGAR|nr:hypothetical protein CVT24_005651 [Panaeolus cyanescens]
MQSGQQERTAIGPVILPSDSELMSDAEEEIFYIYTELQTEAVSQSPEDFRGLGYIDSHKDVLEIKFDVVEKSQPSLVTGKVKKGKKESRAIEKEKTIEVVLSQDKTALHSRKGDTGSVVWKASLDFARFILETVYSQSPDCIFDASLLKQANVVELGAGTGLLSVALSPLVKTYLASDIEPIIPLIKKNLVLNFEGWPTLPQQKPGANVAAEALDWITLTSTSLPLRTRLYDPQVNPVDLLLAVDCLYHPSLIPPFVETIDYLTTPDRTATLVVSELRSEDVLREFLESWMQKPSWTIVRLPSRLLGKRYVACQVPTYGTISITPQISNDLRTETFDGSQELFYSWTVYPAPNAHPTATPTTTKPVKLTTYRSATAYKEIPVQIPAGIRDGQRARLTLMGNAQAAGRTRPDCIDLSEEDIGKVPFPVSSTHIVFGGKGAKGAPKQERIERTYLIPWTLPGNDAASESKRVLAPLKLVESTSFDLDKKIWDSGIGLSAWLMQYQERPSLSEDNTVLKALRDVLFSQKPIHAVELGTGIGIVSVAVASLRSGIQRKDGDENGVDKIFSTDVESALPLLEQNLKANARICGSCIPEPLVLDWEDDGLPEVIKNLGTIDLIMMADVSYNTASFPALAKTLSKLVQLTRDDNSPSQKSPIILLGYKEREAAERTFWDMAKNVGISFVKVGEKHGAGGQPVEIWVGQVGDSLSSSS